MTSPADAILALLNTAAPSGPGAGELTVHDTEADIDDSAKVIKSALPYVVFQPLPSEPRRRGRGGAISSEPYGFQTMAVGLTRDQVDQVLARARARLEEKRPQHTGSRNNPISRLAALPATREQTYHAAGGLPLFYGVDQYVVEL